MSPRNRPPSGELEIIAHRGYSARAPENTLAAVERAIEAGADAVEWDVHVAACGTPVLLHDETLERTTSGFGSVLAQPLEALARLDAGSWFGPDFAGERIPSLARALERATGRVGRVYTEVKGYRTTADLDRMVEIVQESGDPEAHVFISFDWTALEHIARHDGTTIGYIMKKPEELEAAVERAPGHGRALIDCDRRLILRRPELARRALDRGLPLAVWTVNEPAEATRLADAGVTRFTTNEVDALLDWKAARA